MRRDHYWATLLLPVFFCINLTFSQTVGTDAGLYYGPGINADALNNTRVGGPVGTSTGYRFLATHTGNLVSFKHYVIWSTARAGYNDGDGGTLQYELCTDDGTSNHLPSNTVLATVTLNSPMSGSHFPVLIWSTPVLLSAGTIYHITCRNIHADPANNYVSLDNLFTYSATQPANPTTIDRNWAVLLRVGTGAWSTRNGETPILELQYADGFRSGQGQMEIWVGNPKTIGGSSAVREHFTVSGGNKSVSQASVRMRRVSGSEALTMTLELNDGTPVEAVTLQSSSVPTSYAWVSFPFSASRTLTSGQTYNLTLTAPSGTSYDAYPLSDGSVSYGFDKRTTFGDGLAQFTTGSSWVGWDQWGASNRQDGDLQFYFKVSQSSTPPTASLSVSPASLSDFGNVTVGSSSAAQSYTVSGANLTGNVTVTAPTNFQVSLSSGSDYGSSVSVSPAGGTVASTTVYVRFSPSTTGAKSGSVTNASSSVATQNVSVSGTGQAQPPTTPAVSVSATSLASFGTVTIGSSSAQKTYTVSGTNLTGNIVVTVPADFQVSLSSGSGYGSTVSLAPSGGTVASTTIYARFSPSAAGAKSGSITNASSGAATQNVSVSGTGEVQTPTTPTVNVSVSTLADFGGVRLGQSSSAASYTVSGTNLTGNISVTAPADFKVSLNSGSGYGSSVSVGQTGGTAPSTAVYVIFSPGTVGARNGSIANASSGAATKNVSVSGTGNDVQESSSQQAYYGAGVNSDGLNSGTVGGSGNMAMGWRFRSEHTGNLASFMQYITWTSSSSSYNAGNGGTLQYKLRTDDGTSSHGPSNTILATLTLSSPMAGSHFPMLAWPTPVRLDSGSIYHITCENTDADPVNNFVSINNLWSRAGTGAVNPAQDGADWTVMQFTGGAWTARGGETPILELQYADGFTAGQGYMEVWIGNAKTIGGANGVRELFTVTGDDRKLSEVSMWMRRVSGTGRLNMTLEKADGTVIQKKRVFAREVSTTNTWITATFDKAQSLGSGQTYRLSLSAPSGTVYEVYPLRDGSVDYGFSNATVFGDGYAQFTTGSSWAGWDQWGTTDRRDADLQFYFSLGEPLPSPSIVWPTPSAKLAPDSVVLRWSREAGSTSYQIQVAADSEFATSITDTVVTDTVWVSPVPCAPSQYFACVRALGNGTASSYSTVTKFQVGEQQTTIDEPAGTITAFRLHQNYPNPFNPSTVLRFDLAKAGDVTVKIYDCLGGEVKDLFSGYLPQGSHAYTWDAAGLATGTYFCRLQAGGRTAITKMLMVK